MQYKKSHPIFHLFFNLTHDDVGVFSAKGALDANEHGSLLWNGSQC